MLDAFHLGGWGMYPTTIAGLILLFSSVQFARHPEAGRRAVVGALQWLVILTSTLGFVTGVIKTCTHVTPELGPDLGMTVVIGVGESLNNIGLGLCILVLSAIITTYGVAKARSAGADLTDPHAH